VITTFEPTSKLVVADFADTLSVIWDAHIDAQTHAERDDDIVSEFVRPARHDTKGMAVALSSSLSPGEVCRVVVHEQSGTLLVSGQRQHVHAVLDRFDALEEAPVLPGQARMVNLFYPNILPVDVLVGAVRGFFAAEVSLGTVRVSGIESRKHLVIESSQADWQRIQKFCADVDVPARSVAEAEGDEAWREQRAAERIAAEREAAARIAAEKANSPARKAGLPGAPPDGK
jgi:type II secretory pathway component GspD/PulD (secretin)